MIAALRLPKLIIIFKRVSLGRSAIAVRSMARMGIMGTPGAKEAGCNQRIGRLIGGMAQGRAFADVAHNAVAD
jgi:hypothetical protein